MFTKLDSLIRLTRIVKRKGRQSKKSSFHCWDFSQILVEGERFQEACFMFKIKCLLENSNGDLIELRVFSGSSVVSLYHSNMSSSKGAKVKTSHQISG